MKLKTELLKSLMLPVVWACLVSIHYIYFAQGIPRGVLAFWFDRLILFSCFLMYPLPHYFGDSPMILLIGFAAQFLFWWFVTLAVILVLKKTK